MGMDYTSGSIAIGIAGLYWPAGCIFLYLGWRARKPDVYVDGEGAKFLNLTHANVVNVKGPVTLPELHDAGTLDVHGGDVGMGEPEAEVVTTPQTNVTTDLHMDGGVLKPGRSPGVAIFKDPPDGEYFPKAEAEE